MDRRRFFASYTGLLMLLGASLILIPVAGEGAIWALVVELVVVIAIVAVVKQLLPASWLFFFVVAVAAVSEFGTLVNSISPSPAWIVTDMFFGMLLIMTVAVVITVHVWKTTEVNVDIIVGGVAVYVLLGAAFATAFQLIEFTHPGSFQVLAEGGDWGVWQQDSGRIPRLFVFSFVTLTTLGYGDVVPASMFAGILTSIEAVVGPVFLGVFVARLVGLEVATTTSKRAEAPPDPGPE